MKFLLRTMIVLALGCYVSVAHADVVSLNVSSNDTATAPDAGADSAGVLGASGDLWMSLNNQGSAVNGVAMTVPAQALTDTTGAGTGLTANFANFYSHTGTNRDNVPGHIGPYDNGWFIRELNGTPTITITGFNAGDTVDLAVFAAAHTLDDRENVQISANGTDMFVDADGVAPVAYTAGGGTNPAPAGSNHALFSGLATTGGTLTITIDQIGGNGNFSDFNGFQISRTATGVPEPGSLAALGLFAVGFCVRRRRAR